MQYEEIVKKVKEIIVDKLGAVLQARFARCLSARSRDWLSAE